jgi:hypothetical protein
LTLGGLICYTGSMTSQFVYVTKTEVKSALVTSFTNFQSFRRCGEAVRNFGLSLVCSERAMNEQILERTEARLAAEHITCNRNHVAEAVPAEYVTYAYARLKASTQRLVTGHVSSNQSPVQAILGLFCKYKSADIIEIIVSAECHIIGSRRPQGLIVFSSTDHTYNEIVAL